MGTEKILLVEDDKAQRVSITEIINQLRYFVDSVANGEEALKKITKEDYDVILTDLKMPEMGGMELLERIKRLNKDAVVLMITGYPSIETAVESVKKGAYDYITKPFKIDKLELILERALEKSRLIKRINKKETEVIVDFLDREIKDFIKEIANTPLKMKLISFFHANPYTFDDVKGISNWINEKPSKLRGEIDELIGSNILFCQKKEGKTIYGYKPISQLKEIINRFIIYYSSAQNLIQHELSKLESERKKTKAELRRLKISNQKLSHKKIELSLLNKIGQIINNSKIEDIRKKLRMIVEVISEEIKVKRCSIILKDRNTHNLELVAAKGISKAGFAKFKSNDKNTVTEVLLSLGKPIYISSEEEFAEYRLVPSKNYDTPSFIAVPLRVKDETIGTLNLTEKISREVFSKTEFNLVATLADQLAMMIENTYLNEEKKERIALDEQMKIAHDIQQSLLPHSYPASRVLQFDGQSCSALDIGGDYFDVFKIDGEHIGLVVADVVGKGIPAALLMTMTRSLLRAYAFEDLSPASVLYKVNEKITQDIEEGKFITMFYGVINSKSLKFLYTNAGHNPVIVYRKDKDACEFLETEGMVLGVLDSVDYEQKESQLFAGDIVVFYSDGVTEARDEEQNMFGIERFEKIIKSNQYLKASELREKINEEVLRFVGDAPQSDDLTLLVMKAEG